MWATLKTADLSLSLDQSPTFGGVYDSSVLKWLAKRLHPQTLHLDLHHLAANSHSLTFHHPPQKWHCPTLVLPTLLIHAMCPLFTHIVINEKTRSWLPPSRQHLCVHLFAYLLIHHRHLGRLYVQALWFTCNKHRATDSHTKNPTCVSLGDELPGRMAGPPPSHLRVLSASTVL